MDQRITIQGALRKVLFRDECTGYTIFTVVPSDPESTENVHETYGTVTCEATLPLYTPNIPLCMKGKWVTKGKGPVFHVEEYREESRDRRQAAAFLTKLRCGVTAPDADYLTDAARLDVNNPDLFFYLFTADARKRLHEIHYTESKITKLREAVKIQIITRRLFLLGQKFGMAYPDCVSYVRKYGLMAEYAMLKNPYMFAIAYGGLSLDKADRLVESLGIRKNPRARTEALALACVRTAETSGHTYCDVSSLVNRMQKMLGQTDGYTLDGPMLISAVQQNWSILHESDDKGTHRIFSRDMYFAENTSAALIARLMNASRPLLTDTQIQAQTEQIQKQLGIQYAPAQVEAFQLLKRSGIAIVTGGPGTGKTTVVNGLLRAYSAVFPRNRIQLAAPTGRAAQRMSESTGRDACTIHRLIGIHPGVNADDMKTLDADLVVCDEASMIDVEVMSCLLTCVKPGALLLLIGDINQLPSVGAGNVLADLISSRVVPVRRLSAVFRQGSQSPIVKNANLVNDGESTLVTDDTFKVITCANEEDIPAQVEEAVKALWDPDDPFRMQILCPARSGRAGVDALNHLVQDLLNPRDASTPELHYNGTAFRVKDKIIMTQNNYEKGYLNGDLGLIDEISEHGLVVDILGKKIEIEKTAMKDIALAYAITIHKSQGSEFRDLLMVMAREPESMLQRNLLYTGITRAKKTCTIITESGAIAKAARTTKTRERRTTLADRIQKEMIA